MKVITSIFCAAVMFGSNSPVFADSIELSLTYRSVLSPLGENTLDISTLPEVGQQLFEEFCEGTCFPDGERPVTTGPLKRPIGKVYNWVKDISIFPDFSGFCFKSLYLFDLKKGQIYVSSTQGCNVAADPINIAPTQGGDAVALLFVRGNIVGGSEIYKNATGELSAKVVTEFNYLSQFETEIVFQDISYRFDDLRLNLNSKSDD